MTDQSEPELDGDVGDMWMLDFDQLDATSRRLILEALEKRQADGQVDEQGSGLPTRTADRQET